MVIEGTPSGRTKLPSINLDPTHPVGPPLNVLLAEDNLVNQMLAVRLLEKAGHTVFVAGTGRDAVAAIAGASFDLVLMDVQMPEMDGLEAIAVIRAAEKETGAHLPILAMTAFNMKGDRERFLAAGFDGYVCKPIDVRELFRSISAVLPDLRKSNAPHALVTPLPESVREEPSVDSTPRSVRGQAPRSPEATIRRAPSARTRAPAFDLAEALTRVDGDEDLLKELITVFAEEYPAWIADLRAAVAAADAPWVRRAAHTIKGAVDNCGAGSAFDAAFRLERMAGEGGSAARRRRWGRSTRRCRGCCRRCSGMREEKGLARSQPFQSHFKATAIEACSTATVRERCGPQEPTPPLPDVRGTTPLWSQSHLPRYPWRWRPLIRAGALLSSRSYSAPNPSASSGSSGPRASARPSTASPS